MTARTPSPAGAIVVRVADTISTKQNPEKSLLSFFKLPRIEQDKVLVDVGLYGTGAWKDGKHVPIMDTLIEVPAKTTGTSYA